MVGGMEDRAEAAKEKTHETARSAKQKALEAAHNMKDKTKDTSERSGSCISEKAGAARQKAYETAHSGWLMRRRTIPFTGIGPKKILTLCCCRLLTCRFSVFNSGVWSLPVYEWTESMTTPVVIPQKYHNFRSSWR